jgi:peptide-methionine (S)-S-oxide reductase
MSDYEQATFGGGCFWCVEAAFERVRGVRDAVSGYAGGTVEDPTYRQVCSGSTGHAEVVQVTYDPDEIGYEDLLEVFFTIHNPETVDRQGPDVGSQYRSAVYYHDEAQREAVEAYIERLEASDEYDRIVTEVDRLDTFYEAEEKHQDYYEKNPDQPYCRMQIPPKLEKLQSKHGDKLAQRTPSGD